MIGRAAIGSGAILATSQLVAAFPAAYVMGRFGLGPFSAVLASLLGAALVSFFVATCLFGLLQRSIAARRSVAVLTGILSSLISFPVAYALKAFWDIATVGELDPSGSWVGAILATLVMTIGVLALVTAFIPYIGGGLAGYLIWRRAVGTVARERRPGTAEQ